MKTPEQIAEQSRQRAKRHYKANKAKYKAKSKAQYQSQKAEFLEGLAKDYKEERQEAIEKAEPILIGKESKYQKCPYCRHYYDMEYITYVDSEEMMLEVSCPSCHKATHKTLYTFPSP